MVDVQPTHRMYVGGRMNSTMRAAFEAVRLTKEQAANSPIVKQIIRVLNRRDTHAAAARTHRKGPPTSK